MRMSFNRFTKHFVGLIRFTSQALAVVTFAAALLCIMFGVVSVGFDLKTIAFTHIVDIMKAIRTIFVINIIFNLAFCFRDTLRNTRVIKWIVDIAVLTLLLPWLYPHPTNPWIPWLSNILYSNYFLFSVLTAYSIVNISYGVIRVIGKRTNPSLMLASSFLFFIGIGSMLLMLPRSTTNGIDYIDSLYVATSAVCITGLTPVDIAATFTPFGLLIIALLMQIGGLGVMTFTSFFALFFSGNTSIYSQLMVKDMIYSKTINALLPTLLYILGFTIIIEISGAIMIFASIHGTLNMTLNDEIIFSAFHSVSAFCNAGFSNIPGGLSNPMLLNGNQWIYIAASLLIIAGSIGFPILVNFRDAFLQYAKRAINRIGKRQRYEVPVHLYDMNTKIVVCTTSIILAVSVAVFFTLEYDNTLAGMSTGKKLAQSLFNAVTPRSAGFASVNPADFLDVTLIFILLLMWIGGASQSTGGGIKVNTFAAMVLNVRSVITGRERITAFHRTISYGSIRRANSVVAASIAAYFAVSVTMMLLEPQLSTRSVLFESASALFTVGTSLGITEQLGDGAKIVSCMAMFVGRVGIISLLVAIARDRKAIQPQYPIDNIIIN